MNASRAFTLIELLIAMAILAVIGGAMMTMLTVAQRQAKITNTKSILMKVDQAVRLFRNDMKIYPWQSDLSGADSDPAKLGNNLAFRLAWRPDAAAGEKRDYQKRLQADLNAIHAKFVFYDGTQVGVAGRDGTHAFRCESSWNAATFTTYRTNMLLRMGSLRVATPAADGTTSGYVNGLRRPDYLVCQGLVFSRMADEITTLRYLAGQLDVTGTGDQLGLPAPQGIDPADPADKARFPLEDGRYATWWYDVSGGGSYRQGYRYVPYNRRGSIADDTRGPVLDAASVPDPVNAPGQGPVQGWRAEYLAGELRRRTTPNGSGEIDPTGTSILDAWGRPLLYVCQVVPGAKGYGHPCDESGAAIDQERYGMGPRGRSVTTALASDLRTTAAEPFAFEFELWSRGPDGLCEVQRDASANRDNVAILGYTRGLR